MNPSIINFIKKQTCATICCVDVEGNPFTFSCFYAFNSDDGFLYYKSDGQTFHSLLIKQNPKVAGTILPDKLKTFVVQGIQFTGEVLTEPGDMSKRAAEYYYKKHPLALAMHGELWIVKLKYIKMTDSSQGFGKKINWEREV